MRVYQFRHQGTGTRGKRILTENYLSNYFADVAGAAGIAAGAATGADADPGAGTAAFAGETAFALVSTEDLGLAWMSEIATARTENATKDHVVILSRSVVAPREPNVV